jgi:hypothetical protein
MTRRSRETDLFRVEIECDRKGRKLSEVWLLAGERDKNGKHLRKPMKGRNNDDLPTVQKWDPTTGVVIYEAYYWQTTDNIPSRYDGRPAVIKRDRKSGEVIREEWWGMDGPNRRDGPAIIDRDPKTGIITNEEYWHYGQRHRESGKPAVIKRDKVTGEITRTQYFWRDKRVSGREAAHQAEYKRQPAPTPTSRLKPNL